MSYWPKKCNGVLELVTYILTREGPWTSSLISVLISIFWKKKKVPKLKSFFAWNYSVEKNCSRGQKQYGEVPTWASWEPNYAPSAPAHPATSGLLKYCLFTNLKCWLFISMYDVPLNGRRVGSQASLWIGNTTSFCPHAWNKSCSPQILYEVHVCPIVSSNWSFLHYNALVLACFAPNFVNFH